MVGSDVAGKYKARLIHPSAYPQWIDRAVVHVAGCVECVNYDRVAPEVWCRVCKDGTEEWSIDVHAPMLDKDAYDASAVFHASDCAAAFTPMDGENGVCVTVDWNFVLLGGCFEGNDLHVFYWMRPREGESWDS